MSLARTYLFVPATRPDRIDKALASAADAIIIDLEDAVAPADKAAARMALAAWLASEERPLDRLLLRINDDSTSWHADDLALAAPHPWQALMLPKAERPEQILRVADALSAAVAIVPLVETALGVLNVLELARTPGVQRLAFGTLDYALDLGLSGDLRGFIEPSSRLALASRVAGIAAPIAGVTPDIHDPIRLLEDFEFARAFGFTSKLCIHPQQIGPVHQSLLPTTEEVHWAQRVLAAVEASTGAVQVDGKMVDRPVLEKARRILAHQGG